MSPEIAKYYGQQGQFRGFMTDVLGLNLTSPQTDLKVLYQLMLFLY